jgi:hypothetical protein
VSPNERRSEQNPAAPSEQPAELKDLGEKPLTEEEQEKVKGGGSYGWHENYC